MAYRLYRSLFVVFLFCEILLLTTQRMRYMGQRENAIVLIAISAAMGVFALFASFRQIKNLEPDPGGRWENLALKIVALAGLGLAAFHLYREIRVIPIDVHLSDILPTIQVMNQRLLAGQYPYALIREFGYELSPTYLPFMWLPFLPAAWLHFDERWLAFAVWALGSLSLIWRAHQAQLSASAKWLITGLPFFHFILIEEGTNATLGNTVEIMIAGFYMLLGTQLDKIESYLSGKPIQKGLLFAFFISLCLLSRYSFLLWLPLLALVLWMENKKTAIYTGIWLTAIVLLVFVIPFLSRDPMIYLNGLKHYTVAALGFWKEPGNFGTLYDGLGVAGIFRDNIGGEMAGRLAALQRWQVLLCLTVTTVCSLLYWKRRAQIQHVSLFLLGSLKVYFAVFYGFIQMPYVYLMITPCFFSICMLPALYRKTPSNQPGSL